MDRVWNDSGDEGSISDSDYARGNSNPDSESNEWSGDSAESSESSRRRGQPHQNQPALQRTPANMERPRAVPFTGNSGIQVRTVGFGPIDYFSLFITQDLIYYFVTETNRFF